MAVLVLNCGSATLKFAVYRAEAAAGGGDAVEAARGLIGIGGEAAGQLRVRLATGRQADETVPCANHADAVRAVLNWIASADSLADESIVAVGHRVAHGGVHFAQPTLIDPAVLDELARLTELAPLHNGPAVAAIRACRQQLGAAVPMVAVFDTAFHRTLPPRADRYALPHELTEQFGLRRFGFHGTAHRHMAEAAAAAVGKPLDQLRAVTMQLGNGCSATAVQNGVSVDTSMGMTPLEGLVMGTRCGDLDAAVVGYLVRHAQWSLAEVEACLTKRSGLLGLSGLSHDMRTLLQAERQGHQGAAMAVELFCYRLRKYLGAYLAVLGGADAVVFGGGIGENAPEVRARVCADMEWCGLSLDPGRNAGSADAEPCRHIGRDGSPIQVFVVRVDEEQRIARDVLRRLAKPSGT